MRSLLTDRNFALLLVGQTLTMFGDVALFLVLAIWVKDLTGSSGQAGAVFLAFVLPGLIAPFLGIFVDRFPRRRVLILNDVVTGVVILALLFVHDRDDVWLIFAVAAFYGVSQQVFFAARSGLLATMLSSDLLGDANGLLESLRQGLRVIGPVVGAALFGVFGGGATAAMDSATFFASAFFLSLLRVRDLPKQDRTGAKFIPELTEGLRHIFRTPEIRLVVLVFVLALSVVGFLEPALFALVDEGLGRSPAFVGVIGMTQGVGSVLGGILAPRTMRRTGEVRLIGLGTVLTGIGIAPLAFARLPAVVVGTVVFGAGLSALMVGYMTLLQRRTADELQGRVFSAAEAMLNVPFAASIGLGAAIITIVSFRVLYVLNGIALLAAGVFLLGTRVGRPTPPAPEPVAPVLPGDERLHAPEGIVPQG
jgi:MFS family permease